MGQLVEITAVEVADLADDSPLLGASVDSPAVGRTVAAAALEIGGWALGREGRPEAVELVHDGEVLARGTWGERADLASAFPDQAEATAAGFEIVADVSAAPATVELTVRARLGEDALPFARLGLRRRWRGWIDPAEPPLVSVLVLTDRPGGSAVERTLTSLAAQRHPLTEVLVLSPTSVAGPAGPAADGVRRLGVEDGEEAALRNEGIRCSNGELLLLVPTGAALAPDALELAVEMLARRPEAVAVIDGEAAGVGAAIYRRSGFEELGGFAPGLGADCDLELAGRAIRFGALFAPGALLGGGR